MLIYTFLLLRCTEAGVGVRTDVRVFKREDRFVPATLLKERLMVGFCIYSLSVGESVSDSASEKQ